MSDIVTQMEDQLSADGSDNTLSLVGVIFALCFSLYITCMMMRRLWRRYELRLTVVADRIVRKHLSNCHSIMVERMVIAPHWDAMLNRGGQTTCTFESPPLAIHDHIHPSCVDLESACSPHISHSSSVYDASWQQQWCRNIRRQLDFQDLELLTSFELECLVTSCLEEVGKTMWFIRKRRVDDTVRRAARVAYREYRLCLMQEFLTVMKSIKRTQVLSP